MTFDDSNLQHPPSRRDQHRQAEAGESREAAAQARRGYWDEARIMREVYRYSGYAGMIGGW